MDWHDGFENETMIQHHCCCPRWGLMDSAVVLTGAVVSLGLEEMKSSVEQVAGFGDGDQIGEWIRQ